MANIITNQHEKENLTDEKEVEVDVSQSQAIIETRSYPSIKKTRLEFAIRYKESDIKIG